MKQSMFITDEDILNGNDFVKKWEAKQTKSILIDIYIQKYKETNFNFIFSNE